MSVHAARAHYATLARAMAGAAVTHRKRVGSVEAWRCPTCHWLGREIEAASLELDLAVAEASLKRVRESVAW